MAIEIEPTVRFGKESIITVPDALHRCPRAKLFTNRDAQGNPGVILNLLLGEPVQVKDRIPTHGELRAAAVILNPVDARGLAGQLTSFVDSAEHG